jgi:sugar lactone lactonase YvrE
VTDSIPPADTVEGPTPRQARPFVDGLFFGEAPRWHDGRLWYSDFFDRAVFSADESGLRRREADVPSQPSGLGWLPDGQLLVVSMLDRTVLRREPDGTLVTHASLAPWATFHGNDMVVSTEGRAYVGNFGFDLYSFFEGKAEPSTTSLVGIDPDGTAHEAATDLAFPNGSVIFPDGRTLVVAESMALRLTAFEVAEDGSLSGRREWAPLPRCAPDGICLDADGCIWVANALGPECLRIAEGGEVVDRVVTSQPCFACMLGGGDRRTLYAVTAPSSEPHIAGAGRQGRIEQARVDVPGAGLP